MKTRTCVFSAAAALTCAITSPAFAQAPDAEIQSLLGQVAGAYRNLPALSTTLELSQGSGTSATKVTSKLVFKRPNLVAATIVHGDETKHFVVDGATYYLDSSKDNAKYTKAPSADFTASINALAQNGGAGVGLLPILLTSQKAESQIIPGKPSSIKKIADTTVASQSCDTVQAVLGTGDNQANYTFAFAKTDHLLRKLTIGPHKDGAEPTLSETYSDVNITPAIDSDTFKYTPHAGAVAADPPKAPAYFDERLKPGFTPFALKGSDLGGKQVSFDAYKGKVLLVDFWATWCGPCVAELPNVVAAYGKYHSKGFEVLGISLDQPNSRPKLESFIKEHNMPWPQVYDGKYWQAENAVAYGVRAIPFTLLIGKDGKIAAVGARGEELAPAIEAALKK
jgi:peroxiredoxin/outer membrane lipoprotein-sorting protein